MKNLKRALSFALASVMLVGMMVVGAGAADFGDKDKIQNTDAVNTLVALGVLKGKDTGNFDPEGIVTRAEMAKMICVALNGGKDPNLASTGLYPDTKGHWAAGYIDYCSNVGIVSGDTAGNFNPDKTVTGTEAAKMILIAIGFNAENEKFVNDASWATNIGIRANQKDLYKDLAILPAAGLTRDAAAQMIWNGLNAVNVKYTYQLNTVNGNLTSVAVAEDKAGNPTILSEKFNMATKYSYMTGISYDAKKAQYTYNFDITGLGNKMGATITEDALGVSSLKSDKDFSNLYGMKVKVLYKNDTAKTVYGMYNVGKVLAEGVWGNVTEKATTLKFDGTTYDKNAGYNALDYNTGAVATTANEFTFKAIDNNDDGKVDVSVILPFAVAKVTFVGKDSITAGNVSYKFSDCDIYEGVAKDDIVMVINKANTKNDTTVITNTEKVAGDITAVNADGEKRIDGTWYSVADTTATGTVAYNTLTAGDTVSFNLANGYVVYAKVSESTAVTDVLYVAASTGTAGDAITAVLGQNKGVDTRIFLSDGTNSVVKAMRVDVTTVSTGISAGASDLVKAIPAEGLYTYKVNKDGVYELKAVKGSGVTTVKASTHYGFAAANLPGNTAIGTPTAVSNGTYNKTSGKLGGTTSYFIADDAVIYLVQNSNGATGGTYTKGKVVTGKTLKTMATYGDSATALVKSVSGLSTVQVAVIYDDALYGGTDVSTGYGYITSSGYAEKNADGDWNIRFTAWTNEGEKELVAVDTGLTASDASAYGKGTFVSYTNTATAGEITGMKNLLSDATNTITNGMEVAITGWDGGKNIAFDRADNVMKDGDKTVVIYVNTADKKGIEGGSIEIAQNMGTSASPVYVKNAVAMQSTSDGVDVIFVDTANKLAGAGYTLTWATAAVSTPVNGITVTSFSVKDTASTPAAIATGSTVAAGSDFTVDVVLSGTATAATTLTVTLNLADGTTVTNTYTTAATGSVAGTVNVAFSMPYQNVSSIAVALA